MRCGTTRLSSNPRSGGFLTAVVHVIEFLSVELPNSSHDVSIAENNALNSKNRSD